MSTAPRTGPAVLDPERQFLGRVMWLELEPARRMLTGMSPDDLADPVGAFVLRLAIQALAAGQTPDPVVLFDAAREAADRPRETRLQQVSRWILDAYGTTGPIGESHIAYLKAIVLRAAWRRALAEYATRLLQAVEQQVDTATLRRLAGDTARIDALWRRYQAAAADPAPPHIPLPRVASTQPAPDQQTRNHDPPLIVPAPSATDGTG